MLNHSKQHSESRLINDERGAAGLMMVIVMSALVVLIVTSVAFTGLDDLDIGYSEELSNDILLSAESCAEEALIRLSRSSSYSGGSLTVGEAACTITVTGTPCGSCTIDVAAVGQTYTRNIQVGVTVTSGTIDITSWSEQP
jgi:hypothetical protein